MEQLQVIYTILSTIVLLLLGITWAPEHWININVKITLIVLGLAGLIISLSNFGYIIKV